MKSKLIFRILTATMAGVMMVTAAGCASGNQDKGTTEESIVRMAVSSEPDNLNPMKSSATDTSAMMMNVYEGLLSFDKNGSFIPALAESYEITDDGMTYEFQLKEGIQFHSGDEFNAEDVKYTYETLAGLNGESPLNETLASELVAVETPDDYSVQLKLNKVDAGFLSKCTISIQQDGYTQDSTNPNGTGPYKFKEYVQGQKLVLEKNENYKTIETRMPEIDTVEFKIMTDSNAVLMALKSGDLDIASVDARNFSSLGKDFTSVEGPQNMVQIFALNNSGFTMALTVPSNYQTHIDTAQILKSQLEKIGVTVEIQLVEWAQWLENVYNNAQYESTVIGHSGKLDPQDFLNRFTTTYEKNYFKYSNEEYDAKIAEAASVTDETKRAEIYKECQQKLADDAASVFIQDPSINYAVRNTITGMQIYPVTFFDMGSLRMAE